MRLVLTHHPRFRRAALEESALAVGELQEVERPDHSVTVVETRGTQRDLLETVFVQHVAPGDLLVALDGTRGDLERIQRATDPAAAGLSGRFAVQCRRGAHSGGSAHADAAYSTRDVEIAIGSPIEARGGAVDLDAPEQVISVYLAAATAYIGVSAGTDNKRLLVPQHRRYTRTPQISRAEHKLQEAIEIWELGTDIEGARALDVGASPGGWSWVLVQAGARVTAVDPGELDARVSGHAAVTHIRSRAETLDFRAGEFDWVVNDMNVDPPLSAEVLLLAHRWLRDGGRCVCTLKLAGRSRPRGVLADFVSRLEPGFVLEAARHLYSNRQEVTLLLRRS